tara:strand:+ start:1054 stop:2262 length:1209 start_codon:yes stop_codon:yes gene_type:complete
MSTTPEIKEGDFKIKKKPKMKKLGKKNEITKVNLVEPKVEKKETITKVVVPNEKKEEDAVQEQSTNEVDVRESSNNGEKVVEGNKKSEPAAEDSKEETILEEIVEIGEKEEAKQETIKEEIKEAVKDERILPENIESLVSFMKETGGNIEDYVRLNADYNNVNDKTLLREYYKNTRPHLDFEEISFLMEDEFNFDEEVDDERDVRKKKLAYKEEVAKAKSYLDDLKSKYYKEIKLRPGTTQEQQKALDFFNRYNEEQDVAKQQHEQFKSNTKQLFNNDFKGFDFNVGDKKFRYKVQNADQVADNQSNINNIIGKFLNDKGEVVDTKGYHKAMYAASNVDKIANHFYEQGKADAVKNVIDKSKNVSTEPRATSDGNVFINGLKVRAISGLDSSKLTIKKKRFN